MQTVSVIKAVPKGNAPLSNRNQEPSKHIIIICDNPIRYQCTICNKSFKSKSNCTYHKNCSNESLKQFKCSICNRRFSAKSHFNYHLSTHKGENPFGCSKCNKFFKTKHKQLRHEEIHAVKRKNYPCNKCEKSFLSKTSLQNHQRTHTGEKPFHCDHCSRAFYEKKNLIHHLNSLNKIKNWVCEVCGSSFVVKWNLEVHRRTHFSTRSFKCPVPDCSTTFKQKRYLNRHMELHKNTSKYECKTCNLEFSRKDNLRRHNTRHLEESDDKKLEKSKKIPKTNVSPDHSISREMGMCREPNERNISEKQTSGKSKEIVAMKSTTDSQLNKAAAAANVQRESVIKSISSAIICNQISVIKDGRQEISKTVSSNVDSVFRDVHKPIPSDSEADRTCAVIKASSLDKECPNDQNQSNINYTPSFSQSIYRERMSTVRHCPIPKKMMAAYYMNELNSDRTRKSDSEIRPLLIGQSRSDSSKCLRYCDSNLLDLSMKSHEEQCC